MPELLEGNDVYLSAFARFEKELGGNERPALRRLRKAALARFAELGFPTSRNEDWKFTNVAPLAQTPFRLAGRDGADVEAPREGVRAVFVNGQYAPSLSSAPSLPGGVL